MFSKKLTTFTEPHADQIQKLKQVLSNAEAVVIGASAGLSTSAGFVYRGERFEK